MNWWFLDGWVFLFGYLNIDKKAKKAGRGVK
jgi:hypothetical protein